LRYRVSKLCKLMDGQMLSMSTDHFITHVCYDSRLPIYGEHSLFIALKNAKANGHQYVMNAYERGCRTFLVDEEVQLPNDANVIKVAHSLHALQHLASAHRANYKGVVVGITGSWGKTTVKEWLYELIADEINVVKSPKSFNSQLGVALSILNIEPQHEVAIIEAGISEPGEMERLESMIRPDVGVFTTLADAHQANFNSPEQKLREKLQLFRNANKVLLSDEQVDAIDILKTKYPQALLKCWGKKSQSDLQIITEQARNTHLRFNSKSLNLATSSRDAYHFENLLHAVFTASELGVSTGLIEQKAKALKPLAMRLEMKPGQHGITLVNDSYSADFNSLEVGLNYLHKVSGNQEKTLILSEFDQQEIDSDVFVKRLSSLINVHQIRKLVFVGSFSIKESLKNTEAKVQQFSSTRELLSSCTPSNFANEAILVKGARRFQLEKVIHLLQAKSHKTQLELNMNALVKNFNWFKNHLPRETGIMVMLKALSYGAGTFEIARLLQNLGADYIAVAYTDEGVTLRQHGIHVPIMVLNPDEEGFVKMLEHNLEPEIYSIELLKQLIAFLGNASSQMKVHINIDTGMHRLGFMPGEVPETAQLLSSHKTQLKVASVFCHLSSADVEAHNEFTLQQLHTLQQAVNTLRSSLEHDFIVHAGNSAGAIAHPESVFDMVRLGIGFYGVNPTLKGADLDLAFRLSTRISQVKAVEVGESVGYSRSWFAQRSTRIATIPMGYADGLPRLLGNEKGHVYVHGKKAPFVGSICMDMSMIDITDIDATAGDEVVIFENEQQLMDLSKMLNTIPYEVLSGISQRVRRVYLED